MARKPSRKRKLARALEDSDDVIAAINDQFEVIFANDACCRWLGLEMDQLLGATLHYSNDRRGDSIASRLAGICPPPDVLADSAESAVEGFIISRRADTDLWKKAVWTIFNDTGAEAKVVLLTGRGPDLTAPDHPDAGGELRRKLHDTLAVLDAADRRLFDLPSLAGHSDQAKRIRRQVEAAATSQSDCLIVGPAGSGREHIARTIFHQRNSGQGSLVPIHCVIADSQLLQDSIKHWVLDQQDQRTTDWLLLLDVNRLNPEAQNELLGYTRLPHFPMRIIATSETDLLDLVRDGKFLQPLAMHLGVQLIQSVPLTQRLEDIPLISQVLIETRNRMGERQIAGLSGEVMELFYEYRWPGNINELKQVIWSAHDHCASQVIQARDLPDVFHQGLAATRIGYHQETRIKLDEFLGGIEQQLIERALAQAKGNKTKAAQLLGISRARLMRKAAALGIIETKEDGSSDETLDESAFKEAE